MGYMFSGTCCGQFLSLSSLQTSHDSLCSPLSPPVNIHALLTCHYCGFLGLSSLVYYHTIIRYHSSVTLFLVLLDLFFIFLFLLVNTHCYCSCFFFLLLQKLLTDLTVESTQPTFIQTLCYLYWIYKKYYSLMKIGQIVRLLKHYYKW